MNLIRNAIQSMRTVAAALFHRPDLLIVDDGLHEGSGLAAVREIEMTLPAPHIFSTGNCKRVLEAEPNAIVLKKPFTMSALVSAIERAMRPIIATDRSAIAL